MYMILLKLKKRAPGAVICLLFSLLGGCVGNPNWLSSSGPGLAEISDPVQADTSGIRLVDISEALTRRALELDRQLGFAEIMRDAAGVGYVVGAGDFLEISIWEAPPATLFGATTIDPRVGMATARASALPEQMVAANGTINVPFAGSVPAAGKEPHQIEAEIARRLRGKANQPQVLVRVTRNVSSNVTVVGEVAQSTRLPLTAKGERLLDAIAAAGGVRQPVGKVTVQLTRGPIVQSMPLERIVQSPHENIPLAPGDVVTVYFQPSSYTVLGATGKNEEINFEAQGISLAQALARAGGVQDARADARGVFIFRFEDPRALNEAQRSGPITTEGKIPVVYRLDMKNPASFLLAQKFRMRNHDVVYVANAPSAELQKFLNILTSSIFSVNTLINLGR